MIEKFTEFHIPHCLWRVINTFQIPTFEPYEINAYYIKSVYLYVQLN